MENLESGVKRKSRLAVFEHVGQRKKKSPRKKFRTNRFNLDDSSASESELVIDYEKEEEPVRSRRNPLIRLTEERLNLRCEWNFCEDIFYSWETFNSHLIEHATADSEHLKCQWINCGADCMNTVMLMQHVSYHGYLTKLKNIGQNVLDRNNWPFCKLKENYKIPISPEGYTCMWQFCSFNFCTIYDFYTHMELHIHNNPRLANEATNEVIECLWQGCNSKFSTKYKLAEHIRTHTKERIMACPTCCTVFSNKTKLCDHRKRQLSSDLQSYQCSQCLKLFPSERLLREHMRSHINHYKCTMCDMTCPKPSILAKHMRFKHIKEKPYSCPSCPKTFVTKHNLNDHIKTHSKESWVKCELCDFRCRSKIVVDSHKARMHNKASAVYECHCCKKKFRRGGYLTKHLMKIHNYHWPSGHSRFRYLKDQDGVHRLQTVRYESLEVTQEMIRSETLPSINLAQGVSYSLKYDNEGMPKYVLSVSEDREEPVKLSEQEEHSNILITIDDVDEFGNILHSEVVESGDITNSVIGSVDEGLVEDSPTDFGGTKRKRTRKAASKQRKGRKVKRGSKTVVKNEVDDSEEVEVKDEDIRYFSSDMILNYSNFEIKTPQSEA